MKHFWEYCEACQVYTVICGTCGNGACNGGSGTIDGKVCPHCEEAYELYISDFKLHNGEE